MKFNTHFVNEESITNECRNIYAKCWLESPGVKGTKQRVSILCPFQLNIRIENSEIRATRFRHAQNFLRRVIETIFSLRHEKSRFCLVFFRRYHQPF